MENPTKNRENTILRNHTPPGNVEIDCEVPSSNKNLGGPLSELVNVRKKYLSNLFIGYLNINSLRGDRFRLLEDLLIHTPFEIIFIDETKLTNDFTDACFKIDGYQYPPLRMDRPMKHASSYGGENWSILKTA